MSSRMVERVRDFLTRDCDALARFYEDVDLDERHLWSELASDITHMPGRLLEAQAGFLARLVGKAMSELPTAGEA